MEIHVCPILMRTVKFIDGRCSEQCNEDDCPIIDLFKIENEDDG